MARGGATRRRGREGYYLYLVPGLVGLIAIVLCPLLANLAISFTTWKGIGSPRFVGVDNYVRLMRDGQFLGSLLHTLLFIISMTIIPTILGLLLAAALFDYVSKQFSSRWASFFRAGFYLPQILPLTAAGVLWGWMLSPIGIVNTVFRSIGLPMLAQNWLGDPMFALAAVSVVIVWVQVGYSLVIFMAGMARIDPALHEAAQIDGATWRQRFIWITIPMLGPEIFVVILTTVIAALKVFAPVYVLTAGGPNNATQVPSYLTYYHFFTTSRVGYAATIATVQTTFTIILGVVFVRFQARQAQEQLSDE
jgi:raffinose/stachyose/melibiose transport system permease protein